MDTELVDDTTTVRADLLAKLIQQKLANHSRDGSWAMFLMSQVL